MSVIDLSKKRNRVILALDIFLGTLLFSECWPTGVSFSATTTFAGGLTIGDLAAGAHKAVWVRRTVNDCAVTTLRLNQLQAEIEAQPSYRSGHSK